LHITFLNKTESSITGQLCGLQLFHELGRILDCYQLLLFLLLLLRQYRSIARTSSNSGQNNSLLFRLPSFWPDTQISPSSVCLCGLQLFHELGRILDCHQLLLLFLLLLLLLLLLLRQYRSIYIARNLIEQRSTQFIAIITPPSKFLARHSDFTFFRVPAVHLLKSTVS
jgi:hypothetical protein